ncbi:MULTISPECIES: hypothetical protein [Bacteria]|uniref:Tail terminator n=1 Tax=Microbacterium phage Min1 TaxID=446529 RepID=A6N204_9CAUD|nr:tail terminator [Microbacterium phage Min1]ABR10476.1 hypothetical protein [Microbacterium phage Min1]
MRVAPPDLEEWFTALLRAEVRAAGVDAEVGNKEPDNLRVPLRRPLIVVRDDSGDRRDWTTFDRSVGFTVLAGTKQNDKPANDLARVVASIVHDHELPLIEGSPIAAVVFDGCRGPYAVPDTIDVARRYLTGQYVASGSW